MFGRISFGPRAIVPRACAGFAKGASESHFQTKAREFVPKRIGYTCVVIVTE